MWLACEDIKVCNKPDAKDQLSHGHTHVKYLEWLMSQRWEVPRDCEAMECLPFS